MNALATMLDIFVVVLDLIKIRSRCHGRIRLRGSTCSAIALPLPQVSSQYLLWVIITSDVEVVAIYVVIDWRFQCLVEWCAVIGTSKSRLR